MNWLYYLAEANLYLMVFYLAYYLFLKNSTHYQINRAYLLFCCVASFLLPILKISALKPIKATTNVNSIKHEVPTITVNAYALEPINARLPTLQVKPIKAIPIIVPEVKESVLTLQDLIQYGYLAGVAISIGLLFIKLILLFKLIKNGYIIKQGEHNVIKIIDSDAAFSFFNFLFIGTKIIETEIIIRHELVHIRQKHSADIVFIELFKIINWFNPVVYMVQNSLKIIHEYIADELTLIKDRDAIAYSSFLLQTAFGEFDSSITNSFFKDNQLKNRIIMLNKQRSSKLAKFKFLIFLPLGLLLISASTLTISKNYGWIDILPTHIKSVVNNKYGISINPLKKRHLKIDPNGKFSNIDQININKQNKKTPYIASSIKLANNITINSIDDSSKYTTRDGKLILPVVNADGYHLLDYYLHHNIKYGPSKGEKGGLVIVGYSLDLDRHLINVKITKSGGPKLDELALKAFNNYKGIVNDDSGKNYNLGVYFFSGDYSIFKTDSLQKIPNFAGEVIIPYFKYPYQVTKKGYEYVESGVGFPQFESLAQVTIFEKSGEGKSFFKTKLIPEDLKMLNEKYGYVFPSISSDVLTFMNKIDNRKKRLAFFLHMNSYLEAPYSNDFYNHIIDSLVYPNNSKKGLIGTVVLINFNLDENGFINDVKVEKSGGIEFDKASINAIQAFKKPINDNPGKHSIAIVFCIATKEFRPIVSDKFKKKGYVGELAVAESKTTFSPSMVKLVDSTKKATK